MIDKTKGTRLVKLCVKDDLYSETGHPLASTHYDYDQDGKIAYTMREFQYSETATRTMGAPLRRTTRDEYQIIVSEEVFGEDSTVVKVPRIILYEKDQSGFVQQVIEAAVEAGTKKHYPIYYYISYHPAWQYRKGLITRERHLDRDGSFCHEYQYEYNEHGHKTRTYSLSKPEGPKRLTSNNIIEYDAYGNPTRYHNGREYALANKYDKDGKLREAVVTEKNRQTGKWELIGRHEYSYEEFQFMEP